MSRMGKRNANKIGQSNKPTQLTLVNLAKLDKENDDIQTVQLANGKFTIDINRKFRLTQIQKLIIDLQEAIETMRNEEIDMEDIANMMLIYQMLIIKYFSNLPIKHLDLSKKLDIAKIIAVAKQLLDSGIFAEIIDSFDLAELEKVSKMIAESNKFSQQLGEMMISVTNNASSVEGVVEENATEASDVNDSTQEFE